LHQGPGPAKGVWSQMVGARSKPTGIYRDRSMHHCSKCMRMYHKFFVAGTYALFVIINTLFVTADLPGVIGLLSADDACVHGGDH